MTQTYKNETLTLRKCINSIKRFYYAATSDELRDGLEWYRVAYEYAESLAQKHGLSVAQVVGIIAAFSPQTGWLENKRYTVSFLENPHKPLRSRVQMGKANFILTTQNEDEIYNSLSLDGKAWKTKAFFKNILYWNQSTDVTIDRHAIAVCIQHPNKIAPLASNYGHLTALQYVFFENAYVEASYQLGILPHQLHAITWVAYRRLRKLKSHDNQLEFKTFQS